MTLRFIGACLASVVLLTMVSMAQVPAQVMQFLGRYTSNPPAFDAGAAEVVAYDPTTRTVVYIDANSNKLTFINATNPALPTFIRDVFLLAYNGTANSVAIRNGNVAVALEDRTSKQAPGRVLFLDMQGNFRSIVTVGALPDMLTFTPDGTRVITCNEGEPSSDYLNDPEGSVSIINIAGGVTNPTVQTVGFATLNGRQDSLRAMGIRIYGPNSSVAQDFEPEYAAISPDSRTAYVTIQEANALAIIDIPSATLTRVVALGYKDYSRGLPRVRQYPWTNRPVLGTTPAGQQILLGGCSGLWFAGYADGDTNRPRFLTHPDRGPNAEPTTIRGQVRRPFALPNYQAEVDLLELNRTTGAITTVSRTPLFRTVGSSQVPISGRPNLQAAGQGFAYTDEFGIDLNGNDIPNDPFGADLEGIVVDRFGNWWLVDEYRPAIYNFSPTGELIARHVPQGTAASVGSAVGTFGSETLPAAYATRRANRGFEAVAIEGDTLYAFIQTSLDQPDNAADNASRTSVWCRILAFNIVTNQVIGEYLYPMFEKFGAADKIGDAASLGNGRFFVVERDDATGLRARKYIFDIDLKGATNLRTATINLPAGRTIESLNFNELAQYGIRPVYKMKSVYLPGVGYGDFDKVEGLCRIDDNRFALINDNDFGVGGSVLPNPPNGTISINTSSPTIGWMTFDRPNGLDPSDRDSGVGNLGAIRINTWPVYGMYQPDAISLFTVGSETFLITANEGDAREYGTFVEEVRVGSSAVVLDPTNFPNGAALKANTALGRLNISNQASDIDGDGDYDRLFTLGGRSFSIWNTDGNLIWDSGNEFETLTSRFFPLNFNTGHTTNTLDDRSDNKGPEPEATAIGVINDSVYAFIGLERIGTVFMYNVSNPTAPRYVDYINSRNLTVSPSLANVTNGTVGDLGCEVIQYIPASESPNGADMILSGNEISGTVSFYNVRIPRITTVPAESVAVCLTETLTLRVTATGPGLTYQWQKDGIDIAGATSATYTAVATTTTINGTYRCVVRAAGGMAIPSRNTVVTSAPRTRITRDVPTLIQAPQGSGVVIEIDATGSPTDRFQWFRAGVPLQEGSKYRGVTTKRLFINDMQFADTSSAYTCVVTGGCSAPRTRNCAVLIPRVIITQQPVQPAAICAGNDLVLTAAALPSGGDRGLFYRWAKNGAGFLADNDRISGAQSPTLRISGLSIADTGTYWCTISGVPSNAAQATTFIDVRIPVLPVITAELEANRGTSAVICEQQSAGLSVGTAEPAARYEWLRNGVVEATTSIPTYSTTASGDWKVRVYTRCSNTFVESRSVRVQRGVRPAFELEPIPRRVLAEGDPLDLTFILRAGTPELSYQWFRNGVPIDGATAADYRVAAVTEADEGVYQGLVRNSCGQITTRIVTVIVNARSTVSVDGENATEELVISPNPATETAVVHFATSTDGAVKVSIADLTGAVVATLVNDVRAAGRHSTTINTSILPAAGVYTLVLESPDGLRRHSFVVVR
jgi:Esterase-like activity of phytase/Immunoglobulin I-set domain